MPSLILVGGGSSSGKSTIAKEIVAKLAGFTVSSISHDSYYKDLSHLSADEIANHNFDHPDSIDHRSLIEDVVRALDHDEIDVPVYDFVTHRRGAVSKRIPPSDVIILEGIFALYFTKLRELAHLKIYVDVQPDLCLVRRIKRDIAKRGLTVDAVLDQYLNTVRPMHEAFVEPTKKYADIIIPGDKSFAKALQMIDGFILSSEIDNLIEDT